MRQKSWTRKEPAEKVVRDIRRATRKQYSAEEKIRIVLSGLRGEDSIADLSACLAGALFRDDAAFGVSTNPDRRILRRGGGVHR